MGGKHKKSLRAEKAKVKLKGIKLPKGLNVTKTEFKVKKIVFKEQLSKDFNEEEGKRNINIKETLGKLKHHNSSMKMEALKQCKGIIDYKLEDLSRNLGEFVQGIANIILDVESEPRREALKLLTALLSTNSSTIEPFFNILCSYLRCGMTHIQPFIQRDCLQLLDALIANLPNLIASRSDMIFKDFLDMISKKSGDTKNGRTLTLNVENKTSNVKWRSEVLFRLHAMLSTVIEYKFKTRETFFKTKPNAQLRFNPKEPNYFALNQEISMNSITLFSSSSSAKQFDECLKYKDFIAQLMPLMYETWLEVSLSCKKDRTLKEDISLSYDSALSLKIILEIISKIWEIVDFFDQEMKNTGLSEWFQNTYSPDFQNYIMDMFPYKQMATSSKSRSKSKEKRESSGGPECYPQNFNICNLYCKFFKNQIDQHLFNSTLLDYLTNSLLTTTSSVNLNGVEQVLTQIFLESSFFIQNFQDDMLKLLSIVIAKLSDPHYFTNDISNEIFILLCHLISRKSNLYDFKKSTSTENWLSTLYNLLLNPSISKRCLLTLTEFAKQQNSTFLQSLKENTSKVIGMEK
ncbi:TEX10 family protein [Megaselia abdita]